MKPQQSATPTLQRGHVLGAAEYHLVVRVPGAVRLGLLLHDGRAPEHEFLRLVAIVDIVAVVVVVVVAAKNKARGEAHERRAAGEVVYGGLEVVQPLAPQQHLALRLAVQRAVRHRTLANAGVTARHSTVALRASPARGAREARGCSSQVPVYRRVDIGVGHAACRECRTTGKPSCIRRFEGRLSFVVRTRDAGARAASRSSEETHRHAAQEVAGEHVRDGREEAVVHQLLAEVPSRRGRDAAHCTCTIRQRDTLSSVTVVATLSLPSPSFAANILSVAAGQYSLSQALASARGLPVASCDSPSGKALRALSSSGLSLLSSPGGLRAFASRSTSLKSQAASASGRSDSSRHASSSRDARAMKSPG
eukprot:scaffold4943_cov261-Prasinococcus_capsulatus_cf.AAC.2